MRTSRHMVAMLGAVALLSAPSKAANRHDSIANPKPYENTAKRAKVKFGKRVRRQKVRARCAARRSDLAHWNAEHPNSLTLAQMQHPQMRASFEGAAP